MDSLNSIGLLPSIVEKKTFTKTTMFLNVFLDPQSPKRGLHIVEEQLQQLMNATHHREAALHYNIIGFNHSESICPSSHSGECRQLAYYPQGFEEVTLQALHDHCISHPDEMAVYMHNKGSLHGNNLVEKVRRMNTKAALSEACAGIMSSNHPPEQQQINNDAPSGDTSECNACSLQFQTFPFSHVPSNMWAAKCSYVRKLAPPRQYEQLRRNLCKVVVDVYNGTKEFCPPTTESINEMESSVAFGFGRMANERWLPSHPHFSPCQVVSMKKEMIRRGNGWEPWTPELRVVRKQSRRMSLAQKVGLEFQLHEYAYMFGPHLEGTFCKQYLPNPDSCPRFEDDKFAKALAALGNFTANATATI